jgi:hypothetical protein
MRGSREEQSEDRHRQSPPRRRWGWERDGRVRTAQTAPRVTRGSSGGGGQGGWFGNLLRRVARGCSVGAHAGLARLSTQGQGTLECEQNIPCEKFTKHPVNLSSFMTGLVY